MSKQNDRLLGHAADNDGIDEYDNPLPDWWLGLFGITIVWGVGYGIAFHFINHDSQAKRYEEEMAWAAEQWPQGELPSTLTYDEATLAAGQEIYTTRCAVCHELNAAGTRIGLNLEDAEWKYGNTEEAVLTTISGGRPGGMPAWGTQIPATEIATVAAFVLHRAGGPGTDAGPGADSGTAAPAPTPTPVDGGDASADGEVDGHQVFQTYCVACHGADMTGLVGPNLIDDEWLHGGRLDDIKHTISTGVEGTAMINWTTTLSAEQIDAVAQFVHSSGANPLE